MKIIFKATPPRSLQTKLAQQGNDASYGQSRPWLTFLLGFTACTRCAVNNIRAQETGKDRNKKECDHTLGSACTYEQNTGLEKQTWGPVLRGSVRHTLTASTAATAAMLLICPGSEPAHCDRISEILITKFTPVFNDTILRGLPFDFLWPNFHGTDTYMHTLIHMKMPRFCYKPCEYMVAQRKKKKKKTTQKNRIFVITDKTVLSVGAQKNQKSPSVQCAAQREKLR